MPIKLYDTRDAVPEAQRVAAIETKDGKFAAEEVVPELGDKGEAALAKEREARKAEKKRADDAQKELDELKRKQEARDKGITEEQLKEIQEKEAALRKPLEDKLAAAESENRKLKLTDRVKALALASGVMPDRIAKAMKDLEGRVDLTEDGNSIVVKDAAGKLTAETIDDFLGKTYKTEAPFFYAGTGGSGGGSSGSEGNGGGGTYDPVAAGKAAAKEQKATRDGNSLAFK